MSMGMERFLRVNNDKMNHKIHELPNGIKIQAYNNGSYGYWLEGKGWRNIPKQLGETLVKKFSVPIVSQRLILALDDYGRKVGKDSYGLPIDPDTKNFDTMHGKEMLKIVEAILNGG